MDFVDRLVFPETQASHQQDDIKPKREIGEGQSISHRTAVRSLMSWTLHIWTAIARMVELDHLVQRDHRSPRQRHRLA